ncbi:hypothetical protein STXM2123_5214 [Streptomyces sp. F-3]|nr:hypothetical protein STXM2123_5214 [Streptomyces sp. F-3]
MTCSLSIEHLSTAEAGHDAGSHGFCFRLGQQATTPLEYRTGREADNRRTATAGDEDFHSLGVRD